jgi:hypothetical protein
MFKLNQNTKNRVSTRTHWAWLLPILALSPLAMAAKGCDNAGTVGDECPTAKDCTPGGAGTSTGTGNPAGKTCGGLIGATCAAGLFCDFRLDAMCGAADQTGICAAKPEVCDDIYAPVCGCDGKTYSNDCEANAKGVAVSSSGECGGSGTGGSSSTGGSTGTGGSAGGGVCGGIRGLACGTTEYCDFAPDAMCGSGDQTGTCVTKPDGCTEQYDPVCGCDGMTYGNACAAASAAVSVATKGECKATGTTCSERTSGKCATGEYCLYTPAAQCGRADAPGNCTKIPKGQACDAVYDPVCGCDGKTYGNDCEASIAGASIDHTGACGSSAATCGGITGQKCATGYFCNYSANMACGIADAQGTCLKTPDACTDEVAPVCGCDGKDYVTACTANAKGVSVAYTGACKK